MMMGSFIIIIISRLAAVGFDRCSLFSDGTEDGF